MSGLPCDCPLNYIMKENFFNQEIPKTVAFYIFLFLYGSLFLSTIFLYFKGASVDKRYIYVLLMGIACLVFSFFKWALFYLFTIHILLWFKYILKKIKIINSLGKVVFYAIFSGLVAVFEYFLRYGFVDIGNTWFSPVPVISIVIGFSLIYSLIKDGAILTNYPLRYIILISFLTFGLVQGYVASNKNVIIEFVKEKVPNISFGDSKEKCPE